MSHHLSLTGKRWVIAHEARPNIPLHNFLEQTRGIVDQERAKLSDPFLFCEMQKAVDRIREGIINKEVIGIFGDYDADGITGTAQLVRFFRRHGCEPITYLPDRQKDGYGLKKHSIDELRAKGVILLITVDTGISAHKEIAYANEKGMTVIVTDHHHAHGGRPPSYAVIHPVIPLPFPNENLCGSGVALMLVRALEGGQPWEGIEQDLVLATIGTIGDIVPLVGENRLLVQHGLRMIEKLPPCGLKTLIEEASPKKPCTSIDIAFRIVPRINAAGRMAHPAIALHALLEGGTALEELHRLNTERQSFVHELDDEVLSVVSTESLFITAMNPRITPGTAGLLASRITERYGKPSLVAAHLGEYAVASLRSVPAVDIVACLAHKFVSPLLLTFGGHKQAAGCSFRVENYNALQEALQQVLGEQGITSELLVPTIIVDTVLHEKDLSMNTVRLLQKLAPFGQENPEPIFILQGIQMEDMRSVGSESKHLQCRIGGTKGIGFHLSHIVQDLPATSLVDVVCRLDINTWNNKENIQLILEDIRVHRHS